MKLIIRILTFENMKKMLKILLMMMRLTFLIIFTTYAKTTYINR